MAHVLEMRPQGGNGFLSKLSVYGCVPEQVQILLIGLLTIEEPSGPPPSFGGVDMVGRRRIRDGGGSRWLKFTVVVVGFALGGSAHHS